MVLVLASHGFTKTAQLSVLLWKEKEEVLALASQSNKNTPQLSTLVWKEGRRSRRTC